MRQGAAEATRGALGLPVPKASGKGRNEHGDMSEHVASQQCQFRQSPTANKIGDEVAMETDELFGNQGQLLNRPAVKVKLEDGGG